MLRKLMINGINNSAKKENHLLRMPNRDERLFARELQEEAGDFRNASCIYVILYSFAAENTCRETLITDRSLPPSAVTISDEYRCDVTRLQRNTKVEKYISRFQLMAENETYTPTQVYNK